MLVFLYDHTRDVILSPSTEHPTSAWVKQQTDHFLDQTSGRDEKPAIVMHDRDTKFTKEFTQASRAGGQINPLLKASPNLNGRCERFIGTIKLGVLSKYIVFGKRRLDNLVAEFADYYNLHRSHVSRGHLPPFRQEPEVVITLGLDEVEVKSIVGGLIKRFARTKA
ncbi:integrase core domain-containing protein [Planctomicrobium sp. SH664]|uniref:integrase core domain-containing protein n=1 Tax=Planctomicrobium sp. SH664 TaxID=3448125 RepID=UPI003F5CB6A7